MCCLCMDYISQKRRQPARRKMTRKILHKVALQICGAETGGTRLLCALRNLEPGCPERADLSSEAGEDPKQYKSDF